MAKIPFKRDFTPDEIVSILKHFGSEDYKRGSKGEYIFRTVCHSESDGSYKLYYYPDSGKFHCYTDCGETFDLYGLVQKRLSCGFISAYRYVYDFFGIKAVLQDGFVRKQEELDDWDAIRKYQTLQEEAPQDLTVYPESVLDLYSEVTPIEWLDEGISENAMQEFGIRFSVPENKIVIPVRDNIGQLVGVRGRALNLDEAKKTKYSPLWIDDLCLTFPSNRVLYGLWENREAIQASRKILLFEGEKSVLKSETFYPRANFSVAVFGSIISKEQRDLILAMGVQEVFIAFDKEFTECPSKESEHYGDKLIRLAQMFAPFTTTYVLWDAEGRLEYKDSPIDQGQGVFETLMREKIEIQAGEGAYAGRVRR